jgi:hypothetical protein
MEVHCARCDAPFAALMGIVGVLISRAFACLFSAKVVSVPSAFRPPHRALLKLS